MENRRPNAFLRIKESPVRNFIDRCITRNPSERPSAVDLLYSDWLNNDRSEDNEYCQSFCIPKNEIQVALGSINNGRTPAPGK
jgi:serine/threonine protein kinase